MRRGNYGLSRTFAPSPNACSHRFDSFHFETEVSFSKAAPWAGTRIVGIHNSRIPQRSGCSLPLDLLNASPFLDNNQAITRNPVELINKATRPANFEVSSLFRAQTKMQARIIAGIKAGLAHHFLGLFPPTIRGNDPGTYRAAI